MEGPTNVSSDWPAEVIDLFVQESDDKQTLHSCMKVSRSFYQAARRRVFSSIFLRFYRDYKITDKCMKPLCDIFEDNPAALRDVRNVAIDISCDWPGEDWKLDPDRDYDAERLTHLTEEVESKPGEHPEFTRLLFLLAGGSQVHTFNLQSRTQWCEISAGVDFHQLHDNVILALIALRCIPSLRTLELWYLNNPPEQLVIGNPDCDQVNKVDIRDGHYHTVKFRPLSVPEGPKIHPGFASMPSILEAASNFMTSPLSKVVELKVNKTPPFYQYLQWASKKPPLTFSFAGLKELHCCTPSPPDAFHADPTEKETVYQLITHGSPALEFLSIDLINDQEFPGRLSLDLTPSLRHLQFSVDIWHYGNNGGPKSAGFLISLSQFLQTARNSNLIEAVTINVLSLTNCEIEEISPLLDPKINWDLLDAALANPGYNTLKRLTLNLTFRFWGCFDLNDKKTKRVVHEAEFRPKHLLPRVAERREVESLINVVCRHI